jgi:hypothetical protein
MTDLASIGHLNSQGLAMDFDRLYIQDLLDTATRGHLAEQHDITADDGAGLDEPTVTTQSLGEEGDDPEGDIPVDELPFTSGPADVQNPTVTTQALGEEGDDPEADLSSDVPFSAGPDNDDSGDDDFNNDDFSSDDFSDDDVFGVA